MNIIELLKGDHRKAEELIERFGETEVNADEDEVEITESPELLFNQLKTVLILHTQAEEQILYPALKEFDETADLIPEAIEEHCQVGRILEQMTSLASTDSRFQERLEELRVKLAFHIEEEESELFPQMKELCGEERLQAMGSQMRKMNQGRSRMATTR
jgi:hemerythrin superfamily protein